jgi:hypothetical protein
MVFVILFRTNEKGFKHLSGRINRLENNFTQLNEEFKQSKMYTQYPLLEDGGPGGGDQTLPPGEEEGEELRIGIDEEEEQQNPQSRLSRSAPAKRWRATAAATTAFNRKKDKLNQTAPPANNNQSNSTSNRPRTAENARRRPEPASEFREFRQQKAKEKRYNSESYQPYVPATYQPDIEFVYKNEKGALASAKVVSSPVEFSRKNNNNSPPNVPQYEKSNTVRH